MSKRNKAKKAASRTGLWVAAALIVAVVVVTIILVNPSASDDSTQPIATRPSYPLLMEDAEKVNINLGYGMYLEDVAKYTGMYMEDGSDEVITGVLMIMVKNTGPQDIQYAEIELPVGKKLATFTLTNLPVGDSVVLLEKNRMAYDAAAQYSTAIAKNVVPFKEPMGLCSDKIKVEGRNGVLKVTNISGEDITGDVIIYYKNSSVDMLYGGITYRVVIRGGIPKGETQQILAGHYSVSGSRIVHITCGEAT